MLFLKYLLLITGTGLLVGAAGILAYDLYRIFKKRKDDATFPFPGLGEALRWSKAGRLAGIAAVPLLAGMSIVVIPAGFAAVRVSQLSGASGHTMQTGVHFVVPLIQRAERFNVRDAVYTTVVVDDPKKPPAGDLLRVQTKEGLEVGLAVAVRYRLDPAKLGYIYANLPQPVEQELVPAVVATVFREIAPNHQVRELFATRREEIRRTAAERITQKLGGDGIVVKEVMLRDIRMPEEFAKSLEGLLLKANENERLGMDLEVKQKLVRVAELEAEAQKAREVKQAEGQAQITVLQAKAQSDAMQYTLPLKEKQIQQSRLEAEARKEATVKNAEAMAQAKVIDSKAELEKRKLVTEAESDRIRRVAGADAERMRLEAEVLKQNPLLIQKIIAEKLSDKVQIMMVPNDGKFFFANDVLRSVTSSGVVPVPEPR